MDDLVMDALQDAIRDANAAAKRARKPATIEAAKQRAAQLHEVLAHIEKLENQITAAMFGVPPPGADHPFAAYVYQSDSGPVQTYYTAADDRLRVVPKLDAEQCASALRVPGLQAVVRNALERRQRLLAKLKAQA